MLAANYGSLVTGAEAVFDRQRQRREVVVRRLTQNLRYGIEHGNKDQVEDHAHGRIEEVSAEADAEVDSAEIEQHVSRLERELEGCFLFGDFEEVQQYASEGCSLYGTIVAGLLESNEHGRASDLVVAAKIAKQSFWLGILVATSTSRSVLIATDESGNEGTYIHCFSAANGRYAVLVDSGKF